MSGHGPFGGEMGRMGDSTVEGGAGERRTRGSTMGSDIVSGSVSTGSDVKGRTGPEVTGTDGGEKLLPTYPELTGTFKPLIAGFLSRMCCRSGFVKRAGGGPLPSFSWKFSSLSYCVLVSSSSSPPE